MVAYHRNVLFSDRAMDMARFDHVIRLLTVAVYTAWDPDLASRPSSHLGRKSVGDSKWGYV